MSALELVGGAVGLVHAATCPRWHSSAACIAADRRRCRLPALVTGVAVASGPVAPPQGAHPVGVMLKRSQPAHR
jgi:hypothetical protein